MADYHPLIARAVAGLENNTGEARRSLYERARAALVAQLRGVTPALSESDITRERLALEEAIRKVEAEQARRGRLDRPAPANPPPARAKASPEASGPSMPKPPASGRDAERPAVALQPMPSMPAEPAPAPQMSAPPSVPSSLRPEKAEWRRSSPEDVPANADRPAPAHVSPEPPVELEQPSATAKAKDRDAARLDDALRKLRDRFATGQDADVPQWPRLAPREPVREDRGAKDFDRTDAPSSRPVAEYKPTADEAAAGADHDAGRSGHDGGTAYPDELVQDRPRRRLRAISVKVVIAFIVLAVLGALAAVGYRERGSLIALYHLFRGPPAPVTREQAKQPKIEDRIGSTQPDRLPGAEQRPTGPATQPPAAVAQRVVLYEEDPNDPSGKRYVGSVIWRTETISPGPGLAPELAVRANIEIPERRITMMFSMVRNTDTTLPASHTIDVRFNLPPGFSGGGVANVPGILMKQAEQTRGVPLAGIAVKVTNNVFLIGLSSVDTDLQRNLQLLKERTWFDIPVVYSNGSRAILAMEKGTPGERAFNDAFTAWGRTGAAAR